MTTPRSMPKHIVTVLFTACAVAAQGQPGAAITEVHLHTSAGGYGQSAMLTDHIVFFANGLVAREGTIDGRPRECYALYDASRLARLPFNYGRWREDDGRLAIQWQEGAPWMLQRAADGRLSRDGRALLRVRPLDGLRLDGVYQETLAGGDVSARLALRRDGRFVAEHLRERMGCPTQAPPQALAGSGTYDVRHWTLILRFDDGRITLLPLHVSASEDLRGIATFWLNGSTVFGRVR